MPQRDPMGIWPGSIPRRERFLGLSLSIGGRRPFDKLKAVSVSNGSRP